jgi:single-stranded-DNA-specific exonuclease
MNNPQTPKPTLRFANGDLAHLTQIQDYQHSFAQFAPKTLALTSRHHSDTPLEIDPQLTAQYGTTLARLFAARGVATADELDMSVSHLLSANDLTGIEQAVTIIDKAIDDNKRILIVGDFDCDGATSTTLMVRVLCQMGADVQFLVPDRFKFGYGLTPEIVVHGVAEFDPKLIITVDNGISSHDGVAKAKELGVDVVITDHHLTTKGSPDAAAVVNPNQLGCKFGSKALVGVGVAFYVMGRLAKLRRQAGKTTANVTDHLDLVALGTVADVGHLDHNNRILVTHGLQKIIAGQCCFGILAILEQAGRDHRFITADDFGFAIAPRINAAGRMDNMRTGVECLLADDKETAYRHAYELNRLNQTRRAIENQMRDEATTITQELHLGDSQPPKALSLYQDNWHQGVIGIVAGRIKEHLHRPCVVFAPADSQKLGDDDLIKGSARSIAGVHIRDVIERVAIENAGLVLHFGGHAMAAGLTIYKKEFAKFSQALQEVMQDFDEDIFQEQKFTDGHLLPEDFSLRFAHALKTVSVWGNGFASPTFDGVFELVNFRILKDKHLKLTLRYEGVQYPIDAIWFNYDVDSWDYRASRVHILFSLEINEWQGNQQLQLMVKDLAVCAID